MSVALVIRPTDQPSGLLLSCLPDIKLAVLDTPNSLDKAWDLTLISGQTVKKTSQVGLTQIIDYLGLMQAAQQSTAYGVLGLRPWTLLYSSLLWLVCVPERCHSYRLLVTHS